MTVVINGTSGITFPDGVTMASGTSAPVTVAQGGTGSTTLTANNVLLGNGTSALQAVAPGTNGNVLTSNGTTWTSSALPAGGVTSLNGQTGAIVNTAVEVIGSYGVYLNATSTNVAYGGTIAGSSLRQGYSVGSATNSFMFTTPQSNNGVYPSGGTALTGTWRKMGTSNTYYVLNSCGSNFYYWMISLYVRVS